MRKVRKTNIKTMSLKKKKRKKDIKIYMTCIT